MKSFLLLAIVVISQIAMSATIHCEGQTAFTRYFTSGSPMDDAYIRIFSDFRFENAEMHLVSGDYVEVFTGTCEGGLDKPLNCELSSNNDDIFLILSGREHNLTGSIFEPRKNNIETRLLCIN